ncbi:MAG: 2,3-bisphosphoglycerate-independent phosphoglycerate mutase [Sphingobacteriia bacterium]|nr:2,3-bisphosphoglycerate-independent phosphoglycerate mutase [Sphingobacteriia bacterium]
MENRRVLLMILDGWGIAENPKVSAIEQAKIPNYHSLIQEWPNSALEASGKSVGLPEGQMGNSEVGHMNLGAGRIVYQDLDKITQAISSGRITELPVWKELIQYCKQHHKPIHIMGLVSDGGVHSSLQHLLGLLDHLTAAGLPQIYIHAFTDGRDTDPHSGKNFLDILSQHIEGNSSIKIISLIGRYYAMDRDHRWERVKLAYDAVVLGKGARFTSVSKALQASYDAGESDEFILPKIIVGENEEPILLSPEDAVCFFNFRTDRARELTEVLTLPTQIAHGFEPVKDLFFVTFTRYDEKLTSIKVLFDKDNLPDTLGETIGKAGLHQLRVAETEKYPHVTFFFNGGREEPFFGEDRKLCDSPKVATYDLQPEMSAYQVKDAVLSGIDKGIYSLIVVNFANPDMVGHTGVFKAAVKACEVVDECLGEIVKQGVQQGYSILILADHGNVDKMENPDGSPNTAHTTAKVPCILVNGPLNRKINNGILGDIAPTILELLGVDIPKVMEGKSLLK